MKHFKRLFAIAFIFVLFFSSCNENDEEIKVDLISVFVSNEFLLGYETFIVASDINGDVIDFAELQRGDTTNLSSTSFGENFTLSLVYTHIYDNGKYLHGTSFYNMKPGGKVNFNHQDEFYFATMELSNFSSNALLYTLSSNDDLQLIQPGQEITSVRFNRETSRIFTTKYENDVPLGIPAYYSFPTKEYSSFEPNSIDFSTVNKALSSETVNTGNTNEIVVRLHGILGTGESREIFPNIVSNYTTSSSLDFKYPGNVFNSYASTTILRNENYEAFIFDNDSKYNFTKPSYTYTSEGTGTSFTFSVSGGDWIYVAANYNNSQPRNDYNFDVYVPTSYNHVVNMVKLPQEIVGVFDQFNYVNWEFDHQSPAVVDYEDFSNVEEYLRASNQEAFNPYDHNSTSVLINPDSEGGRTDGRKRTYNRQWEISLIPGHPRLFYRD